MATLPQGADLRKSINTAQTPDIRSRAPDYSPLGQSGAALAQGVGNLGRAARDISLEVAAKDDEVNDYETRKRLMDFKLQTEMELEDYKRNMPVGGDGYAQSWLETYKSRAADFVGKDDSNIPASQRAKVGLALKAHEVALVERAQRDQNAEKDRYTIDGLETTVQAHRSRVEADPNRLGEVQGEVGRLIDLAPLTPAQRHVYGRKVRESISEAAALSIADRATSAQGLEEARRLLAPNTPDRQSGAVPRVQFESELSDPKVRRDLIALTYAEVGGQGKEAQQQFMETIFNRAAARGLTLSQTIHDPKYFPERTRRLVAKGAPSGTMYDAIIDDVMSGSNASGFATGNASGTVGVGRMTAATNGERFGIENHPKDKAWAERAKAGELQANTTEAYAGPLTDLPIAKRRAAWAKAQGAFEKARSDVAKEITAYESNAAMGILPPAEILDTIKRKVEAVNDDTVTAQFNSTFRFAQEAAYLNKLPPQTIEAIVNETAAKLGNEMTPEQGKRLEQVRKLEANVRSQVNSDPLTYAHRVQLEVPVPVPEGRPAAGSVRAAQEEDIPPKAYMQKVQLQPLDFNAPDIDDRLRQRAEQARNVGSYYSQPPQFFTKIERDALKDALNKGGPSMMFTLGKLYQGFGSDAVRAMGEIAETAPEAAIVGKIVAEGGNMDAATDVAKGLELRRQKGHISHVDNKMRDPEVQVASQVLSNVSGVIDPVIRAADAAYDFRHKSLGMKEFNVELYRKTVAEIMGEKVDAQGRKWGGVGYQGSDVWDGKWKTPVLVPHGVAQDGFDSLVGALKQSDLAVSGTPLDASGKPLRMVDVQRATWLSLSGGRYLLQTGTDAAGTPQLAVDGKGQPYVMNLNPVLPELKKRVPEVFADGQTGRQAYDTRLGVPSPVNDQTGLNSTQTKMNRQFRERGNGFKDDARTRHGDPGAVMDAITTAVTPQPGGPSLDEVRVQSGMPQKLRED